MPQDLHSYSLEDAEALPVFMEPVNDQIVVAPVNIEGESRIILPDTVNADSQLVYLVIAAGPGRRKADDDRIPMDYKKGDLVYMSGRQLITGFDFMGYVVYLATAQSVAARVDREKLFDIIKRAKDGEFRKKMKNAPEVEEDKLDKKYGKDGDKPKIVTASS